MKKTKLLIFITAFAVFMTIGIQAYESEQEFETGCVDENTAVTYIPDISGDAELAGESFEDYILENLRDVETEIDISRFNFKLGDINELTNKYAGVIYLNYDVYYALTGFNYSYYPVSGIISTIRPKYYTTDKNQINAYKRQMELRLNEILSYTDDSMTDIQKLITVYDRIILEAEYDNTLTRRTAKDLLIDGTAVCSGYTTTLCALANKLNIPSGVIRSNEMNHIWNVLYIDGEWYHADATWDDPTNDKYSRVNHTHFLKSDDWMTDVGRHYGFNKANADSTKYDDAFWNDVNSSIITVDGKMYYVIKTGSSYSLCSRDEMGRENVLYSFNEKWYSSPNGFNYWIEAYSGLCYYNERLYFNTASAIKSVDMDGKNPKTVYTLEDEKQYSIYGCFSDGNLLRFGVGKKDAPNSGKKLDREYIELDKEPEYVAGDMTGDDCVDVNDAILLLQYSLFPELYPISYPESLDFTGDGTVDMNDAILVLQHSLFPELYPLGGNY